MTIAEVHGPVKMPDSAFAMWVRGELDEYLHVPDGSRVEIIGGKSSCHLVRDSATGMWSAPSIKLSSRPSSPTQSSGWRSGQNSGLVVAEIQDGYIPDLFLLDSDVYAELLASDSALVRPDQIGLAVDVTSPSNAADDRPPGLRRRRRTKWNGYAASGVPFYLLIDRDPRARTATLFSEPDRSAGCFERHRCWKFGDPIVLPEPFNLTIPTDTWTGWRED